MRWILAMVFLAGACLDKPDCISQGDNTLLIAFKKITGAGPVSDTVILYHITATGADTAFYKQQPTDLPDTLRGTPARVTVNPFADSTEFVFRFPAEEKILRVHYQRNYRFINEKCFSEVRISNLQVTFTNFDSVRVVQPVLLKKQTINLEIFR